MSYLRRHKRPPSKRVQIAAGIVLAVCGLYVLNILAPSFFPSLAHTLAEPLWGTMSSTQDRVSTLTSLTRSKRDLVEENMRLRDDLVETRAQMRMFRSVVEENRELRDLLGRMPEDREMVMATVRSRPPQAPYDVLVIDGGERQGFAVGDAVFFGDALYLGEIVEVFPRTARVSLASSPGTRTEVFIEGVETALMAEGTGAGTFTISVPREFEVESGSTVHISGTLPWVLAEVVEVDSPDARASHHVYARAPFDIFSSKRVFVSLGGEL